MCVYLSISEGEDGKEKRRVKFNKINNIIKSNFKYEDVVASRFHIILFL